jgi:hypothetical protein
MTARNSRSGEPESDRGLAGSERCQISDLDNFVRWLREPEKQLRNGIGAPQSPLLKPKKITEAWFRGDSQLHINLGIWPHFPSGNVCQLCADLQRVRVASPIEPRNYTVPLIREFYIEPGGMSPDWLNRPVLVASVDARQKHKDVFGSGSSAVSVRLRPTHLCDVCDPNAGQFAGKHPVEFASLLVDGEVHGFFLSGSQLAGFGGSTPASDQCPRKMIERGSVVVGDVAKDEIPPDGNGINLLGDDSKPVAFRVILRPEGPERIGVSVCTPGLDLNLQRLGVMHGLRPLEPCAVEQGIVTHEREPISVMRRAARPVPGSTHTSTERGRRSGSATSRPCASCRLQRTATPRARTGAACAHHA